MPETEEPDQVTHEPVDDAGGSRKPSGKGSGLRGRLLGSLEGYLTRAATELDDRGEELRQRSAELDRQTTEIEAAEATVAERERRLAELGVTGRDEREQIDALLSEVATRDTAHRSEAEESARLRAELERRDADLVRRTAETGEHARRLSDAESRARELAHRLGESDRQVAELTQRLGDSEQRAGELAERVSGRERELTSTIARLEERERHIVELEAMHRRELDALLARLAERDRTLADAQLALEIARVSLTVRESAAPARPAADAQPPGGAQPPADAPPPPRPAEPTSDAPFRERGPERREPVRAVYSAARDRRTFPRNDASPGRDRDLGGVAPDPALDQRARPQEEASTTAANGDAEAPEAPTDDAPGAPADAAATGHLLFVPTAGRYVLVDRDGRVPAAGEDVEANDARFRVSRVAPSPLPGDARRCAYLQAID